ncbi:conserved hypothetical protein [Vibrio chagasii]|uniref:hypothetical protein n=1 Tax=Vibrio chagasii TaxID=170679 RepID=UPI00338C2C18|nr:conserved hypothetical protein [Vibrio chagasii]
MVNSISLVKSSQHRLIKTIYERIVGTSQCLLTINELNRAEEAQNAVCVSGKYGKVMLDDQAWVNFLSKEFGSVFNLVNSEISECKNLCKLVLTDKIDNLFKVGAHCSSNLKYFQVIGSVDFTVGLSLEYLSQNFVELYSKSHGVSINKSKLLSLCNKEEVSLDCVIRGVTVNINEILALEVGSVISTKNIIENGLELYHDGDYLPNRIFISNGKNTKIIVG